MDTRKDSARDRGVQPPAREQRGLVIARERAGEIWPCGNGYWRVPSCGGEAIYLVDVRRESCSCEDHLRTRRPCKHLFAVLAVRAKTAPCAGCGLRFKHRDLYPVGDDHLTFFEGDQLCEGCAGAHGVL